MYNPLVMSKMFLLHDAKILDKFDSDYLFWIDGGITNTVHEGYFTHDKVIDNLPQYIDKFSFICFPYKAENEIHGFEYNKINEIAQNKIEKVARGGFFGGPKESIVEINSLYYQLLISTLSEGYMGTEESIFSIMCYKYSDIINYFEIEGNGLINKFFEDLKNKSLIKQTEQKVTYDTNKTSLYVIGFNSPNQLQTLIDSMNEYDRDFIDRPKKYLLNNSTDRSTDEKYKEICEKYDFTIIWPNDNLGICGGRQFIAEHFDSTDMDYYFFFEDDMFFYPNKGEVCKNGFNRYVENLYSKTREKFWPEKSKLPVQGLDSNAPRTVSRNIKSLDGVPYADGEIYYCNWPQIVSRDGNKKMFLDTKWAYPYEQTWMSHMYQITKEGILNPAILLLTPTEHNRFEHYSRDLRKES